MGRKIYLPLVIVALFSFKSFAQTGEIKGRVVEKGGSEGVPFASVAAMLEGVQAQATTTDLDGYYVIKPLNPGKYDVKATCVGYTAGQMSGVIVTIDKASTANIDLGKGIDIKEVDIIAYVVPLIDKGTTAVQHTITYEDIQQAPLKDINSIATQTAGVYQADNGSLNIRGARSDGTAYYVDGVKVIGSAAVASRGAEQITVITGGTPAQYGDATGGIIAITSRGPSKTFALGLDGYTSTLFDQYNNSQASFNLSGPIFTLRDSVGRKSGQPLIGFFVTGDYNYDLDPNPSAIGNWKVKDDVLKRLEENPLVKSTTGFGFDQSAQFITFDSMEHVKPRANVASQGYTLNARIDIKPTKNVTIAFGGAYTYDDSKNYIDFYSLMNYNNNTQSLSNTLRAWGRITQRFGSQENQSKSASTIKNAYYTIQADYQSTSGLTQNAQHTDKVFDYGYIGKFKTHQWPYYYPIITRVIDPGGDTISGTYNTLVAYIDTEYSYQYSPINPVMANITQQYYNLAPDRDGYWNDPSQVAQFGGLLNGDNRKRVYGIWAMPGRTPAGYGKSNLTQFSISASGSADIGKHNLVFGVEYQQREERVYNVGASALWNYMRLYGNFNIQNFDTTVASHSYLYDSNGDTLVYQPLIYSPTTNHDGDQADGFFENVRKKFGLSNTEFIDIDNYDPDQYSLNLFSIDELHQNGLVGYYGYDAWGNVSDKQPSLLNYISGKDGTNNFTRDIGAYRPIYVGGYIQDKFSFNDLIFNIGLRVDRFDANQPAIKDKYLLYSAYTAGTNEAKALAGADGIPSNIKSDYVVYVNDYKNPTTILGYRNEDKWYNTQGEQISDLSPLTHDASNSSGTIQPYIIDAQKQDAIDKKLSLGAFGDYNPQTSFMPRIAFAFPISDNANFKAHYDILTQRPTSSGEIRFDPGTYYNLATGLGGGGYLANPNLQPSKTTDYEIQFEQKLTNSSAFSISAFYREMRDMIEAVPVINAYPVDYFTLENIDFGTVKGLTFGYDLRRTGNIRMNISYTLQFASGTGSSSGSNSGLIAQQGQSNLREPKPLDFDQRHTLVTSIDYHYGSGKDYNGPVWGKKQVLANSGFNLVFNAGSGKPYTKQANITPTADATAIANGRTVISGQVNGSRYPWQFRVDAKFDKDFELKFGKKANGEKRKPVFMKLYFQILNVLDAQNIISIYAATGSPEDDGYLSLPSSQTFINGQVSSQAYRDLYRAYVNRPDHYSLPRRIRFGMELNF